MGTDEGDILSRVGLDAQRIGFGDTPAIVVVDLQNFLTHEDGAIGIDMSDVVTHTNDLIAMGRQRDVPIVFVRNVPYPDGRRIGKWAKLTVDTELADPNESDSAHLDDRLDVQEDDAVVDKHQANAFHETPLDTMLTDWDVDTVILTGCSTSGCIRATALGSCANGYRTVLPEECLGDRSPEQHEANLYDIHTRIGDVVPLSEVTDYLGTLDA